MTDLVSQSCTVQARVSPHMNRWLARVANLQGRAKSDIVREALSDWLARHEAAALASPDEELYLPVSVEALGDWDGPDDERAAP